MIKNDTNRNWGDFKEISYFAQGFLDLEDIVNTINDMIERNVSKFDRSPLKKLCNARAVPLKNRSSGMIIIFKVPCILLENSSKKVPPLNNMYNDEQQEESNEPNSSFNVHHKEEEPKSNNNEPNFPDQETVEVES
ncbi:MAG: hypothetical protein ABIJ45_00520 [Candidatus Zixiibacteriota bacterium]